MPLLSQLLERRKACSCPAARGSLRGLGPHGEGWPHGLNCGRGSGPSFIGNHVSGSLMASGLGITKLSSSFLENSSFSQAQFQIEPRNAHQSLSIVGCSNLILINAKPLKGLLEMMTNMIIVKIKQIASPKLHYGILECDYTVVNFLML